MARKVEAQFFPGATTAVIHNLGSTATGIAGFLEFEKDLHASCRPHFYFERFAARKVDGVCQLELRATENLIGELLHLGNLVAEIDAA